jgi:hypothetical protein
VTLLYVAGGLLLGAGWHFFSPRADCYAPERTCLFFAGETSNVFFIIDSWFAGIAAVLGILFGVILNRNCLSQGFRSQLYAACLAIAVSYAAARGVELMNPLQQGVGDRAEFASGYLSLSTPSALLVWAFFQQLTFGLMGSRS